MAQLKGTEQFVAESLQTYFSKSFEKVDIEEGNDPPDIYLTINGGRIAIEITDIDQNVLKDRRTIDNGYLKFIDNLDKEFGSLVDKDKKLILFFHHNYVKVSAINKKFKRYLKSLIAKNGLKIGADIEDYIDDVSFKISVVSMSTNGKRKIAGAVMPFGGKVKKSRNIHTMLETISDCHLLGQTYNIVQNRIVDKSIKCKDIEKPVWLALCDNYYNKFTDFNTQEHFEHYKDVFKDIKEIEVFEKILVIFENGDVMEFDSSANSLG
jgi:hypothetical protein